MEDGHLTPGFVELPRRPHWGAETYEIGSRAITTAMAGARAKSQAIGSSEWIQNEREQSAQFMDQEVEEFSYSVRNELEWLNEHMAEIFSKNQVYAPSPTPT